MEPTALSPALLAAILTASTRLVCPGPTPTVANPVFVWATKTTEFDLTSESTVEPNLANDIDSGVPCIFVTHFTESQSTLGGPWI